MSTSDELYRGREQSQIKHFILQHYLTDMAFKVAQAGSGALRAINYVDGFSGPWQTQDEARYSDTSFGRAIAVMRTVRDELQRKWHAKLQVRFVFCEENRTRHRQLLDAVASDADVEIHPIHGRFELMLDTISGICRDGFTFTFIDPTGFKLHTAAISEFLRARQGEFLWNYMADHANRFLTREGLEDAYGTLLAEERWIERINDPELKGLSNEQRVLAVLRERLKDLGCAQYVLDFPVLRPRENRVQFRLLFGTRSAFGVAVFRAVQKRAERFQATLREEVRQGETGALLLSPEAHAESLLARDGIDGSGPKQQASGRIHQYLAQNGASPFAEIIAPILETDRLTEPGLKDVLMKMRDDGLIKFSLPPRKRKPQNDTLITAV